MPVVGELVRRVVQPLASSHRLLIYAVVSAFALAAVILNALRNYSNFYSVAIYLSRSSRSVLVLANFGFLTALVCGRILQKVFFGPLLPAEVERLYDRIWYFVTESLLAFTMFRDEFDLTFGLMFGFLLFIKCFHWLLSDRIEWMDQRPYPGPPPLFHIRIPSLFTLLSLVDAIMFMVAVESTLNYGVGVTVLFANEYAILMATAWNAMAKYGLSIYELRRASTRGGANAPPWEAKSQLVFYIELVTDFFKLSTYLVFFTLIMSAYGLPLNIVRDVYMTGHSFVTRLYAFHRYRTATRDMNERYPDATEAELTEMSDRTCIICREELTLLGADGTEHAHEDGPNMTPKKLPCGHIFHFQCLRSWLERQQNCPTCRRTVLEANGPQGDRAPQGQQAPAVGGLAPPPQRPAGQARPWGLFAQGQGAGAAPGGQQPAQGGIGGLLGRFFGAAGQPPLVPGQFGNGPLPQQPDGAAPPLPGAAPVPRPRNAGAAGVGQHPPALVFEYNYVHDLNQGPRLMQPPMLQGFYREDGLWQGWPIQGRQNTPARPVASRAITNASTTPTAGSGASSAARAGTAAESVVPQDVQPAPAVPAASASPTTTPRVEQPATQSSTSHPLTPREAAAMAAIRRYAPTTLSNVSGVQLPSSSVPTSNSTSVQPTGEPQTATNDQTKSTAALPPTASSSQSIVAPTAAGDASAPSTAPHTTTPAAPSAPATNRITLPAVIPLYDFGRANSSRAGTQAMPGMTTSMPLTRALNQQHRQHNGRNATGQSSLLTPRLSVPNQPRPSYSRAASSGSLHTLPQRMTEEELNRMDRLTREAIDERIQVLEGVNGAVHRCLEELLRLRSVLPPVAPRQPETSRGQNGQSTNKGKGKETSPTAATSASDGRPVSDAAVSGPSLTAEPLPLLPGTTAPPREEAQELTAGEVTTHTAETSSDGPAPDAAVPHLAHEQLAATVDSPVELASTSIKEPGSAIGSSSDLAQGTLSLDRGHAAELEPHVPGVDRSSLVPADGPEGPHLVPLASVASAEEDRSEGVETNGRANAENADNLTTPNEDR